MSEIMEFQFVAAARRGCKLLYTLSNKQLYKFKSQYKSTTNNEITKRYVCYQKYCKASVQIRNNEICHKPNDDEVHSDHQNQELLMKELQLKRNIKAEVPRPSLHNNKIRTAFNAECRKNKESTRHISYKKMQRNLRRIKAAAMPKSPKSPQDFIDTYKKIDFMKEYGMCESEPDKNFYQTTVVENDFSYTLFFSLPIANVIKTVPHVYLHYLVDATFSVVPSCGYKQLLIVHFGFERHVFPFAFVLMSKKNQKSYEHIFRFINANLLQMNPRTFTTDFEKALRNAILKTFPDARLKGCWFHFCQSIRRTVAKMPELAKKVKTTDNARRILKKILVLPLLPAQESEKAFNICKDEAYNINDFYKNSVNIFEDFFNYFQRQWIEMETPKKFSVHSECVRTTSAVEGYNSYLSVQMPMHGSFWDFLRVIKQEEFQKYTELRQILDGVNEIVERPKKRIRDRNEQIELMTSQLKQNIITLETFLTKMTNKLNNLSPILLENTSINEDSDSSDLETEIPIVDGALCEICFKNKKNILMKPCRHAKLCRQCFDEIKESHEQNGTLTLCPFCRQIVGHVYEIFI